MKDLLRIKIDARVCGGRPCIGDTRMRVQDILGLLAVGTSRAEILADYPFLADEDISEACAYAQRLLPKFDGPGEVHS